MGATSEGDLFIVALVTTPDEKSASSIAKTIVEEKLAACVNILPKIRSIYQWEGKICDEAESLLVIKAKKSVFETLAKRVIELHPYDLPEVISLPISSGSSSYLNWIEENVR